MKIGIGLYTSALPFRVKKEPAAVPDANGTRKQPADAKQTVRETLLRQVADMRAAMASRGENDPRVRMLIDRFKSGVKLTPDEMAYLRRHAPAEADWIERIAQERAMLERGMRAAPTKTDVQQVVLLALNRHSRRENAEEVVVRARHIADAQARYTRTEEYRKKPFNLLHD